METREVCLHSIVTKDVSIQGAWQEVQPPVSILLIPRQLKTREHESLDETIILVRPIHLHADLANILS